LLSVGGIIGIIIAIVVICLVCSWWKRKKLAEVTRRLTTTVGKGSQWMRKSLRRMTKGKV
jgi:NADH:ubiquinone oxidoreductase subunit H